MLNINSIFKIHQLRNEGFSIRQITKNLGIGRNTVTKYLTETCLVSSVKRKPRISKLHPYHKKITEYLRDDPLISGTSVFKRLKNQGYKGGISILRSYLIMGSSLLLALAFSEYKAGHSLIT